MVSIFIAILIAVFFFFPLMTYIIFWYDTGNSPYRDELAEESGGRTTIWILKGLMSSILSHIIIFSSCPLAFVKRFWQPASGDSPSSPPVILIHGLYHNASAWIFYKWWLRRAGYQRVYLFNYNSLKSTFWEISSQFDKWMAETALSFPGEAVLMVGHSLGGLLAKAYAGKKGEGQRPAVRVIVTLGSPHKGSRMVVFGMGRLAKSLTFGSTLIRELEEIRIPSGVSCTAIYSPVDNMVLPAESLKAPPDWNEERTVPICHVSMLYHWATFKQVLKCLKFTPLNAKSLI
jgi:triacylglycerol esterase/lipase EstA (alpha/beta hydrolase family)